MRRNRSELKLSNLGIHIILIVLSLMFLYPLSLVVLTSFKGETEVFLNPFGLPQHWNFANYIGAWNAADFGRLFLNSIYFTIVSTCIAIFCASLAAYGLTRAVHRSHMYIYLFFVSGIFIPFQLSIIPLFKIIKDLHLFNTYTGVLIVYTTAAIPFGVYLMTTFMKSLPKEITEAGIIDGCSYFGLYKRISLPLIKPVIVTYGILQSLSVWNDFFIPYLLLPDIKKQTLTTGVLQFKQQFYANYGYLMASITMMVVPVVILYILLQKHIIKGITGGAVKG